MCLTAEFYHENMKRWEVHDPLFHTQEGKDKAARDLVKAKWKSCLNSSGMNWSKLDSGMWIDFSSGITDVIVSGMCIWTEPVHSSIHYSIPMHLSWPGSPGELEPIPACIRRQAEYTHSFSVDFAPSPCVGDGFPPGAPISLPTRRFRELETLRLRGGVNLRASRAPKVKPERINQVFLWLLFWEVMPWSNFHNISDTSLSAVGPWWLWFQ